MSGHDFVAAVVRTIRWYMPERNAAANSERAAVIALYERIDGEDWYDSTHRTGNVEAIER